MEITFLVLRFLLAVVLYVFLGWALWLLWTWLQMEARKSAEMIVPPISITEKEGGTMSQQFDRPEVIIGRQPGSDLRLSEKTISARHARLIYHHGQWWVEDLRSRNGTYLNDERITTSMVIANGDILRCGNMMFRLDIGRQTTSTPNTVTIGVVDGKDS